MYISGLVQANSSRLFQYIFFHNPLKIQTRDHTNMAFANSFIALVWLARELIPSVGGSDFTNQAACLFNWKKNSGKHSCMPKYDTVRPKISNNRAQLPSSLKVKYPALDGAPCVQEFAERIFSCPVLTLWSWNIFVCAPNPSARKLTALLGNNITCRLSSPPNQMVKAMWKTSARHGMHKTSQKNRLVALEEPPSHATLKKFFLLMATSGRQLLDASPNAWRRAITGRLMALACYIVAACLSQTWPSQPITAICSCWSNNHLDFKESKYQSWQPWQNYSLN